MIKFKRAAFGGEDDKFYWIRRRRQDTEMPRLGRSDNLHHALWLQPEGVMQAWYILGARRTANE
jgi:hypothetical protein